MTFGIVLRIKQFIEMFKNSFSFKEEEEKRTKISLSYLFIWYHFPCFDFFLIYKNKTKFLYLLCNFTTTTNKQLYQIFIKLNFFLPYPKKKNVFSFLFQWKAELIVQWQISGSAVNIAIQKKDGGCNLTLKEIEAVFFKFTFDSHKINFDSLIGIFLIHLVALEEWQIRDHF